MANHPIPDHDKEYMKEQHGTEYLITDPASDKILREVVGDDKNDRKKPSLLHEESEKPYK